MKVKLSNSGELNSLMDDDTYSKVCEDSKVGEDDNH
jgi:hypothetical protein